MSWKWWQVKTDERDQELEAANKLTSGAKARTDMILGRYQEVNTDLSRLRKSNGFVEKIAVLFSEGK